jgi:GAF domain-containing protein
MDLAPLAQLCTALGQAIDLYDAAAVLEQTAGVLDSIGLIVWAWDPATAELTAALAHGYSNRILAQLPRVRPEDENATAAAFRSGEISVVAGEGQAIGALAVPLLAPSGRVGVLACELKKEQVRSESVRALAAILAAQLARLVEALQTAEAADRMLA